jgi:hypothetical protein
LKREVVNRLDRRYVRRHWGDTIERRLDRYVGRQRGDAMERQLAELRMSMNEVQAAIEGLLQAEVELWRVLDGAKVDRFDAARLDN